MIMVNTTFKKSTPIAWNTFARIATSVEGTPISSFCRIFILGFGRDGTKV